MVSPRTTYYLGAKAKGLGGTFFGRKCNLLFYNILTAPFSTPCWTKRPGPRTPTWRLEMRAAPSALDGGNTHQYLDQTTAFFIACRFLRGARTQVELSAVYARALKRVLAVAALLLVLC